MARRDRRRTSVESKDMTRARAVDLTSDAPLTDASRDAYGMAPFAQRLATAIVETPYPEGLVMAVHGAWGSGKTTVLNFVRQSLEGVAAKAKPVVIEFNPWWFDDRHVLAQQFLAQFSSKLPHESMILRKIGDTIADYSDSVGTLIATATGVPILKAPAAYSAKLLRRKVKDVPTLKTEISKALRKAGKRFLFIIDDIDRLTAEEIREVFKVIKALANFPNVVYLLAFDRLTVSAALTSALKMDGEAYLEKIVQASFTMPAIDRALLRQKFNEDLNRILTQFPATVGEPKYWFNVYYDGLDQYLRKPRDVVRIINALCVTYPAVAGEVNFVDFVSLEFLRVFEPTVYASIRDNPDRFTGRLPDQIRGRSPELDFHNQWLERVSDEHRAGVKALVMRLFPRLNTTWGKMGYSADHDAIWRRKLRACSPDVFEVYFQFGLSKHVLGRQELNALIAQATDPSEVAATLVAASKIQRQNNNESKARQYLERLRDIASELSPSASEGLLSGLFNVGDSLFPRVEDAGFFPSRWLQLGLSSDLLKQIPKADRYVLLDKLVATGEALTFICSIIDTAEEWRINRERSPEAALAQLEEQEIQQLRTKFVQRLHAVPDAALATLPELDFVVHRWQQWDDPTYVANRLGTLFTSDELLPQVLEGYMRFGSSQSVEDAVATRTARVNPKDFERFTDIMALEPRVRALLGRSDLTPNQRLAGHQYLKSMKLIHDGKDPGGIFAVADD